MVDRRCPASCALGRSAACILVTGALDLVPGGRERVPSRAELVEALAARLAWLRVADVVVEGMAVVGDFRGPIRPAGRAQQGGGRPVSRLGIATGGEGWPHLGAAAIAGRFAALVLLEQIEGSALPVHEDRTQLRVLG